MEKTIMQWVLQDIPLGRNIQNIRMAKNMTQMQVVEKMQLIGSTMSRSTWTQEYQSKRFKGVTNRIQR